MPHNSEADDGYLGESSPDGYALSGKIMLSAIVILFAVVIFMVCLHLYARWYLLCARRRTLRSRRRRSQFVFYVDPNNPAATTVTLPTRGLDVCLLNSIPVFVYSSKTHPDSLECAVCLSEFEDNEKGRLLPKCNHSFHTECIDMWFHSHSTCPLCRSPVEPGFVSENTADAVISVGEPVETDAGGTGSSSELCSTCQHEEVQVGSLPAPGPSSNGARRKPLGLAGASLEIPIRNVSFGRSEVHELGTESPASQVFKSPGSRLLSLKRILSRGLSPSGSSANCGAVTEFDIERGTDETQHTPASTPRAR